MTDAFLAVLAIAGWVSVALVLAGLVSDGLLPWLERRYLHPQSTRRKA